MLSGIHSFYTVSKAKELERRNIKKLSTCPQVTFNTPQEYYVTTRRRGFAKAEANFRRLVSSNSATRG